MGRPQKDLSLGMCLGLLAAAGIAGCDGGAAPGCETRSDCGEGFVCRDGMCAPSPTADGGGRPEGDGDSDLDLDTGPDGDGLPCGGSCGDGTCIAGVCCEALRSCGEVCCGAGQVCSFGGCVEVGSECAGEEDCPEGAYCEPLLGEAAGSCGTVPSSSGRCLPRPPVCPEGELPDPETPTCVAECRFTIEGAELHVEERYHWGEFDGDRAPPNVHDVRSSPIVINLDDDDCDGRITGRDVPEIVVITSPDDTNRPDGTNAVGDLVVLEVEGGELLERWRVEGTVNPWTYLAAGDFDGLEGNEIVAVSVDRMRLLAYGLDRATPEGELVLLWESPEASGPMLMPSLADLDHDGDVEIITSRAVFDGATGLVELEYDPPPSGLVVASDVDGDPGHTLELVTSRQVYGLREFGLTLLADNGIPGNFPIVVDLDGAGLPEIVGMNNATHTMTIWRYAPGAPGGFEIVRDGIDINGSLDPTLCAEESAGRTRGGGPPTAGDVNADGLPDIAVAGGVGYAVLDGARLMDRTVVDPLDLFFWHAVTVDCSSAETGSSVFDFNGDGRAEVLYGDEQVFRIYEGRTGNVLFETCNTNGTILEGPVVADVDGDGGADVVVVSNARYRSCTSDPASSTTGVRVFGSPDGDWVRTRRVWNQHPYHITNVGEDGSVPRVEAPGWADPDLNNYRLNRQPGGELAGVDAVVSLSPRCAGPYGLAVTIRNLGEAVLPAGARARVYRGAPVPGLPPDEADLLGEVETSRSLYPAQAEELFVRLGEPDAIAILVEGEVGSFAVVEAPDAAQECRPDNDIAPLRRICSLI